MDDAPHFYSKENEKNKLKGLEPEMSTTPNLPLLENEDVSTKVIPEEDEHEKLEELAVEEETKGICSGFNLQSFVLLIALSMHAIFEGIALGLTNDFSATLNIMIALLLHKPAASLSLGASLTKSFKTDNDVKKGILLLSLFALATPIGIILGMALQRGSDMVEIVFNSFAGGTFLYIAASEVIVEEFSMPDRHKWI